MTLACVKDAGGMRGDMANKVDEQNRRADKVNPVRSGIRTGNPQLRTRNEADDDKQPAKRGRQAAGKPKRRA